MTPTPDNMEPFVPRKPSPADGVCVVCRVDWKTCECGPLGDVLDLEHATTVMAEMEARGVVR